MCLCERARALRAVPGPAGAGPVTFLLHLQLWFKGSLEKDKTEICSVAESRLHQEEAGSAAAPCPRMSCKPPSTLLPPSPQTQWVVAETPATEQPRASQKPRRLIKGRRAGRGLASGGRGRQSLYTLAADQKSENF